MALHHASQDLGPTLLVLTCTLAAIAILTTCLRLWVRKSRRNLGWDDASITLTMLLAIARMGIHIVSIRYGNGRHRETLTEHQYMVVNMLTWYTGVLLFPTMCLLKTSICILLLRIKDTPGLRYFMGIVVAGLIITNFECLIVLLAECSPTKKYWDMEPSGYCWPAEVRIYSIYVQASYSVVTDLICTTLPVVVVWSTKIPLTTKFGICGLMSMGLIATICSIIRAASLGTTTSDLSYAYCIAAIWAKYVFIYTDAPDRADHPPSTELFLGIIAANLALARSMISHFSKHVSFSSSDADESHDSPNLCSPVRRPSRVGYVKSPEPLEHSLTYACRSRLDSIPLHTYIRDLRECHVIDVEKG